METSPGGNNFDVLHAQLEHKEEKGIFDSPLKRVPQPTEISPLRPDNSSEDSNTTVFSAVREDKIVAPPVLETKNLLEDSEEIKSLRENYIEHLIPYLARIRTNRVEFTRMMNDLKTDRHMPLPDEPGDLKPAREAYLNLRRKLLAEMLSSNALGALLDVLEDEKDLVWSKIKEALSVKEKSILEKGTKIWNSGGESGGELGEQLVFGTDFDFHRVTPVGTFTGFRADTDKSAPGPTPVAVKKVFDGIVRSKVTAPEVKVDIKTEPKVESETVPEPVVVSTPETISSKPEEKIEEKVEIKKADENASTLQFEGKPLEIIRSGNNGNEIKVTFDGKEIGRGTLTAKGPDVKLDKNFKGGFLLAETVEEKAFKVAMETIKTLKIG